MERRSAVVKSTEGQDEHDKTKEQIGKSNLMQGLAGAKSNGEESMVNVNGVNGTCKHDKARTVNVERPNSLEKKGWKVELEAMKQRYESALWEVQSSKQAMEGLKHELMVCVEAKDEAVRMAGEAMSAAESTARRIEELSAELTAAKGTSMLVSEHTAAGVDGLMDELPETLESNLLDIEVPLKSNLPDIEVPLSSNLLDIEVSLKSATLEDHDTKYAKDGADDNVQNDLGQEMESNALFCSLEILQKELAAAKEAEEKAQHQALRMQADMERVQSDAERCKMAESIARASFARTCSQLEETEERLAEASVQNAVIVASLESLKVGLEKSLQEVMEASIKDATVRNEASEVLDCMEKTRESNEAELLMCEEKEMSASAMVESLQADVERHKSEIAMAAEEQLMGASKIFNQIKKHEQCRTELVEQQKRSFEIAASSAKPEADPTELVKLEEMEPFRASRISSTLFDVQTKQAEVDDLKCRLFETVFKDVVVVDMEAEAHEGEAQLLKAALAMANASEVEAEELQGELVELAKSQADAMEAVSATGQCHGECTIQFDEEETGSIREHTNKYLCEEEVVLLKEKLSVCEEQLEVLKGEADGLLSCNAELVRELEIARAEKEVSKRAAVDAHQLLTHMEQAKRFMEADIQRLLHDSKLWKSSTDTRDILALSVETMNDSRDEKPQPDSPPERLSVESMDPTSLHVNGGGEQTDGVEAFAEKEEEEYEMPVVEEPPMRMAKRKKNALLHRLHSYLDKKKTMHAA